MTKVSEVYINRIPQLPELMELPSISFIPIYNANNDITGRISAILLKGGTEAKNIWDAEVEYIEGDIVEFQLKFWKSQVGTIETPNVGNAPMEGSIWTEVSKSTGNGYGYWSAGVFTQDPSMVIRSGGLFLLDNTKVTFPFNSDDFEAEYQQGIWVQLTGSGSGGGFIWNVQHIDSAITTSFNAVKNTIYLIDATTAPVTGILPDAVAENVDDYAFVLHKDTHKFTLTTVSGTQLIDNDTSQVIPTIGGGMDIKCVGNGYDIVSDTRQLTNIVEITANRDFSTDGFENNIIYQIKPNGGEITILFPTAYQLPGNIAIKSRFEQIGAGKVSMGAVSGNIGTSSTQVLNGDGQGIDIVWSGTVYSVTNDTRPNQLTASLASYPVSELSTITDPVRGTFFNQRVTTIEDSRFDKLTAVETSTIITANPTDPWQCFSGSITDEGVLIGDVAEGIINLISNSRRTGINVNIYFQYLKRDTLGNYTSIAQSSVVNINSDTTSQYIASATHALFSMLVTDRIVVRGYARKSTTGSNPTLFFSVEGPTPTKSVIEVSAGTIAHNTLAGRDLQGAHKAASINVDSSGATGTMPTTVATVQDFFDAVDALVTQGGASDVEDLGVTTASVTKKMLKVNATGDGVDYTEYDHDQVVQVGNIDMSDIAVGEKKILVAEKGIDGSPEFGGAIGLLDVIGNSGLSTRLAETSAGWNADEITLTGDNRQGQLGENSQFYELESDFFLCKSHYNGTTASDGWAVWKRNRGTDCLSLSVASHVTIIGQLETETGWNESAQFKQITAKSKRGTWFRRSTGGYLYMCIDDTNGWTRVGSPPTVDLEITSTSHPVLAASLTANDWAANPFYLEGTNASDNVAQQGQEWWDTTNKRVYKRNMNGYWARLN